MQIIPMRDLKNTVEVERRCAEENGPVYVTKNGYGRLVVMDIDYYERTMQKMYEAKAVLEGLADLMESKYQYRLSQKAEADLDGIVSYIAVELSNPQAASDFVDKLGKVIDEIRSFPESGSYVNNDFLSNTEIRKKLIGSYIMYYLPVKEEKMIYVVRIVYGKRNMEEILRELDL